MAAIWAGRTANGRLSILCLDGAKTLGAKILVAGGGRCNVTHDVVDPREYAGSSPKAIGRVLSRFGVDRTVEFFAELGVTLKREPTGKLFPTTDKARTVLDALLGAARDAGVELLHPWRVGTIDSSGAGFTLTRDDGAERLRARSVILATGGKSLPRSGSDGGGYEIAQSLGHSITPRIFPALVALTLGVEDAWLRDLSGLAAEATLEVRAGSGKRIKQHAGSTLCTHFGLSGPGPMDISRYLTDARLDDPDAHLVVNWLAPTSDEQIDDELVALGPRSAGRYLREKGLAERLAEALCLAAGVDPATPGHALRRDQRRSLVRYATATPLHVTGDRGWNQAEVTAGGVPLDEIDLKTMRSRRNEHLGLCGEICNVDGRIGGYNFQWAWASGFVCGTSASELLLSEADGDAFSEPGEAVPPAR